MHQPINAIIFKFVKNPCPDYLNEVYEYAHQCRVLPSSRFLFRKLMWGRKAFYTLILLYGSIYPDAWKKTPLWILLSITWKNNILVIYLEAWVGRIIIGIHLHCIPFFIYLSIYLFIYLLIYFSLLLFWPFIVTFILLFYHLLYLLSQCVSYYLHIIYYITILLFHYVPNPFLLLMLQCHYLFSIYAFHSY